MPPSVDQGSYYKAAQNLSLPNFIKCATCQKNRTQAAFSSKQLNEYKVRMNMARHNAKLPRCRTCVGGQVTELTCNNCGETKGLFAFSKAQRRNPDAARCIDCVQEHLDIEPNLEDAIMEEENEMQSKYGTTTSSVLASFSNMSVSSRSNTASDVSDIRSRDDDSDSDDGVWISRNRVDQTATPASARQPSSTTGTGWDAIMEASSKGYTRPLNSRNQAASSDWVKMRSHGVNPEEKRARAVANEQRYREISARMVEDDDENDEDDDGDGETWEL